MGQDKCPRGSPTFLTPTRPLKKIPLRARGSRRGSPTFLTPTRPPKKIPLRGSPTYTRPPKRVPLRALYQADIAEQPEGPSSRRRLSLTDDEHLSDGVATLTRRGYSRTSADSWSEAEVKALVEFILFHCNGDKWPTHHQMEFWNSAACFIQTRAKTSHKISGIYM